MSEDRRVRVVPVDDAGGTAYRLEWVSGGTTGTGLFVSGQAALGYARQRGWPVVTGLAVVPAPGEVAP